MLTKVSPVDVPAKDPFDNDCLNRDESAEILTQVVGTVETPFVLAVFSPWGTGKTTFIRMWRGYLDGQGYRSIYFNAWENDYAEDPMTALIAEVADCIRDLGDGESRAEMEQLAASLPSAESIHFLGFRNDRLELLSQFDLFVMTSSDEGIPRCLMEAIAMEIPVAAYNIPGIDQLVMHQQTGLLATYGDQQQLKEYWLRLLSDRPYAEELARHGRDFVNERYSGKRMATEYTDLYQTLLCKN